MYRASVPVVGTFLVLIASGCATSNQQQDLDFTIRKLEQERDQLRLALGSEQARSEQLRERMETEQLKWNTTQAEASRLRESYRKLSESLNELQTILKRRSTEKLQRPAVAASPLPPTMDEALAALVDDLGDRVWYDRSRAAVSFANDRLFDSGSDVVRADAHAALHELAAVLASDELADFEVIVVGHTDETPISRPETLARHPTNWHLSVHRAIAVEDVLVKAGLPPTRVGVMGYGQYRPISDDPRQNRRVEIFIVRRGGVQPFEPVRPD